MIEAFPDESPGGEQEPRQVRWQRIDLVTILVRSQPFLLSEDVDENDRCDDEE